MWFTEYIPKIKEKKVYYDSFFIAGFSYYEGTLNFKKLEVGDKVDMKNELRRL